MRNASLPLSIFSSRLFRFVPPVLSSRSHYAALYRFVAAPLHSYPAQRTSVQRGLQAPGGAIQLHPLPKTFDLKSTSRPGVFAFRQTLPNPIFYLFAALTLRRQPGRLQAVLGSGF
jgi:hypothetical protein